MFIILFIITVITIIVAIVATLIVGKDVSSKINQYEAEGDSLKNELERSEKYEKSSLQVNIRSLSWIYVVLFFILILVCIAFLVF